MTGKISSAEAVEKEASRLAALEDLDMLDTPGDPGFDRLVELIKEVFSVDIGLISLIDAHRQWYIACDAFPWNEVPRDESFCKVAIANEAPVIIPDASCDSRFAAHPAVTGAQHIRFYAGVPLKTSEGYVVGTVCAIDRQPKSFSEKDLQVLERIAQIAMDRIDALQSAATDGMTGLLNRRAFKDEAEIAIAQALRNKHELSCILLDIDHFKSVNDTYGHAAGDEVIKTVASACREVCRSTDRVGRLGGEELAIILPQLGSSDAATVAERLRQAIEATSVTGEYGTIRVTVSLGVTAISNFCKDVDTLLSQADIAMYRAKQGGRNRWVTWEARDSNGMAVRRRVLKAGAIIFKNKHSSMDCTIKTLGHDGAGLAVSNAIGIPPEFTLSIPADELEMACRVIAQDSRHIEVAFR